MRSRVGVILACALASLLGGCHFNPFTSSSCKEVMEKDGTMFRICESHASVTVEQLGAATPEQLRERYRLREEARGAGLSVLIRSAAPPAGAR